MMLNWDELFPASTQHSFEKAGHWDTAKNTPESALQVGQDLQEKTAELHKNVADLHKKAAFVPVCPSEKPPASHLPGQPKPASLLASGRVSQFVPLVPPVFQWVSSSTPDNSAHGGGAAGVNFASENEESRFLSDSHIDGCAYAYPLNPSAVCLLVAACEKVGETPEEIGRHLHSLHRLPPAEQVRRWLEVCLSLKLIPRHILAFESPGEAKDCMSCANLDTVLDRLDDEPRCRYRWACKLGYLVMEYGRATERIILAPPECESWERHYPGPWR